MATKGIVKGIVSNLVTVEVDGPVSQNEICYISVGGVKLMSEVIKVIGKNAFVQVFESTRGMRVGDEAEFQGHMLEVTLGPGMLSRNYDGLQILLFNYFIGEGDLWELKISVASILKVITLHVLTNNIHHVTKMGNAPAFPNAFSTRSNLVFSTVDFSVKHTTVLKS